ncbi:1,3-beta-galactosyl-N-acetylhexosamine phosphorylase [Erysipelothrix urinaevulpis]|uniref:1,3-beta-galactosyl-N-acetylhexosamine phosphorylase n=1 Tax=Erysipelothrix urinaevulpis TaxID=2683717 RepID=UPI001357EEDC|nr:1,3-beta-galactosyl-N-acetylhexosamine phosphorylase [Erysipelothrix urinaevulpis]
MKDKYKGRVTLPVELDFYEETLELSKRWGADAIRDSDGTDLDAQLKLIPGVKVYSKYFVARGDNEFALNHMEEAQQIFVMSEYITAYDDTLDIEFRKGFLDKQIVPNYDHDSKRYWQVYDRTTNEELDTDQWELDKENDIVSIKNTIAFHEYTVNFLAYMVWDPTQMYNYITNNWTDREREVPFDVRGPKANKHVKEKLRDWLEKNPETDVVRFTTFFYHFTLFFNDQEKEKFVDWFGYGSSVSPLALDAFELEYGYTLKAEDFIQAGYYNSTFKNPSQKYLDYIDFQQRFVCKEAKELVDLVHEYGKEAIMFLGDNWIGTEPYGKYFESIGIDGVVGSVGGGATLRLIADIPHVKYTEGRFLPYFFPDTFYEGNDPTIELMENWVSSRRAILRNPLNRIGYGGYPSLAYKFPKFVDRVEEITDEFRGIIDNVENNKPYAKHTVAILNSWGKIRTWQAFMVAHALYYQETYSYFGLLESLSGLDVDVKFISFDDIINHGIDEDIDVIINAGDAHTAFSGDDAWNNPTLVKSIRSWVHDGHGFIGIGEPSAYEKGGRFFQLADILGIDQELGFKLSTDKYHNLPMPSHFITQDMKSKFDYGERVRNIYALSSQTEVIADDKNSISIAANAYGKGRGVYLMGMKYSHENTRILKRSIYYSLQQEDEFNKVHSSNLETELNVYPQSESVALVNNTSEAQKTLVYDFNGNYTCIELKENELKWGHYNVETGSFSF